MIKKEVGRGLMRGRMRKRNFVEFRKKIRAREGRKNRKKMLDTNNSASTDAPRSSRSRSQARIKEESWAWG